MLYLPDTNLFSAYFQRRDERLLRRVAASMHEMRLSSLVLAELEYGATKSGLARHRSRIEELVATLAVEPFLRGDSASYGRLRAHLATRGEIIGAVDLLIASQALRLGATVVTHNTREFSRVPGLKFEDWQSP